MSIRPRGLQDYTKTYHFKIFKGCHILLDFLNLLPSHEIYPTPQIILWSHDMGDSHQSPQKTSEGTVNRFNHAKFSYIIFSGSKWHSVLFWNGVAVYSPTFTQAGQLSIRKIYWCTATVSMNPGHALKSIQLQLACMRNSNLLYF